MHVVILCCFKLCIWFYIRSRALQSLCLCVWFYAESKWIFLILSYLMLVPVLSIQYKFVTAASFLAAALYVGASVCGSWTRVQRGTRHVGSCSDLYTVLLFCLYFLAILVCNFACDLCCFIVNVYWVKSSVNKVFLSYLILKRFSSQRKLRLIEKKNKKNKIIIFNNK